MLFLTIEDFTWYSLLVYSHENVQIHSSHNVLPTSCSQVVTHLFVWSVFNLEKVGCFSNSSPLCICFHQIHTWKSCLIPSLYDMLSLCVFSFLFRLCCDVNYCLFKITSLFKWHSTVDSPFGFCIFYRCLHSVTVVYYSVFCCFSLDGSNLSCICGQSLGCFGRRLHSYICTHAKCQWSKNVTKLDRE